MTDAEILQEVIKSLKLNAREFALELGLYGAQPIYNVLHGKYGLSVKMKRKIAETFPEIDYDFLEGKSSHVQTGGDYSTNLQNISGKMKIGTIGKDVSIEKENKLLREEIARLNLIIDELKEKEKEYRDKEKKYLDLLLKSK